jgi:hypothetical protein
MKAFLKIVLVTTYVTTALFVDWGHTHFHTAFYDGIGGIFNHDCGTHELHKPLDSISFCFICYQLSTSNSLLKSFDSNLLIQNISAVSSLCLENLTFGFFSLPPGRSPPKFS